MGLISSPIRLGAEYLMGRNWAQQKQADDEYSRDLAERKFFLEQEKFAHGVLKDTIDRQSAFYDRYRKDRVAVVDNLNKLIAEQDKAGDWEGKARTQTELEGIIKERDILGQNEREFYRYITEMDMISMQHGVHIDPGWYMDKKFQEKRGEIEGDIYDEMRRTGKYSQRKPTEIWDKDNYLGNLTKKGEVIAPPFIPPDEPVPVEGSDKEGGELQYHKNRFYAGAYQKQMDEERKRKEDIQVHALKMAEGEAQRMTLKQEIKNMQDNIDWEEKEYRKLRHPSVFRQAVTGIAYGPSALIPRNQKLLDETRAKIDNMKDEMKFKRNILMNLESRGNTPPLSAEEIDMERRIKARQKIRGNIDKWTGTK
jgi:hypothetical protein